MEFIWYPRVPGGDPRDCLRALFGGPYSSHLMLAYHRASSAQPTGVPRRGAEADHSQAGQKRYSSSTAVQQVRKQYCQWYNRKCCRQFHVFLRSAALQWRSQDEAEKQYCLWYNKKRSRQLFHFFLRSAAAHSRIQGGAQKQEGGTPKAGKGPEARLSMPRFPPKLPPTRGVDSSMKDPRRLLLSSASASCCGPPTHRPSFTCRYSGTPRAAGRHFSRIQAHNFTRRYSVVPHVSAELFSHINTKRHMQVQCHASCSRQTLSPDSSRYSVVPHVRAELPGHQHNFKRRYSVSSHAAEIFPGHQHTASQPGTVFVPLMQQPSFPQHQHNLTRRNGTAPHPAVTCLRPPVRTAHTARVPWNQGPDL